ncbi:MAG TPA: hypothetical protein VGW34_08595 [Allosphingosinicella sp.]|nr:hypothetical protein [Allosphingosinicella sp.]
MSDPEGAAILTFGIEPLAYRFASKAATYLICPRCGVYVGAVAEIEGATFATLNLNVFDDPHLELEAAPVSYEGESAEAKARRRRERWTPARIARSR